MFNYDIIVQELQNIEITPISSALKILISFVFGAIIGLERQSRRQSVGMRTVSLICIASTAAMLVSIWIPQTFTNAVNGDPGRIAAQVLSGVGFLGAGAIIQSRGSVKGLTTAATIWVVSIIGLCVGAGLYTAGFILTITTLFVLFALDRYEQRKMLSGDIKLLTVEFNDKDPHFDSVIDKLKDNKIYIYDISLRIDYNTDKAVLILRIHVSPKDMLEKIFADIKATNDVSYIDLASL